MSVYQELPEDDGAQYPPVVANKERRKRSSWYVAEGAIPAPAISGAMVSIYAVCVVVSFAYGICAIQYGLFHVLGPYGPLGDSGPMAKSAVWAGRLFAPFSGRDYQEGPGSVEIVQLPGYGQYFYFMSVHQICGGIMMFCGIVQMNSFFRTGGRQKWHRVSGRIYVIAHLINLYGSAGWLVTHTSPGIFPESGSQTFGGAYGGSIFLYTLWLYWIAGITVLTMGVFHICRGEVQRHRYWMSMSYGVAMGAPFLRVFWTLYGTFTGYRMDQINQASVLMFITSFLIIAACFSSFAHRQTLCSMNSGMVTAISTVLLVLAAGVAVILANQYLLRFFIGTPDLAFLTPMTNATEAMSYQAKVFASGGPTMAFVAALHVASWSTALILGAILLRMVFLNPKSVPSSMRVSFVIATFLAGMTMLTWAETNSFASFLQHPEATDKHFYKDLPRCTWDCIAIPMLMKATIFMVCSWFGDTDRAAEWLLHVYGHLFFYTLFFPALWVFAALLPSVCSFQDAFHHAALTADLGGQLVGFILGIYIYNPEQDKQISAVRHGIFRWRAKAGA